MGRYRGKDLNKRSLTKGECTFWYNKGLRGEDRPPSTKRWVARSGGHSKSVCVVCLTKLRPVYAYRNCYYDNVITGELCVDCSVNVGIFLLKCIIIKLIITINGNYHTHVSLSPVLILLWN